MNSQKPMRGIQLNKTHPLAKGLVGCWLFNEATGETVFDLSGNGNNGTLENGVAWGNGGLEFDGDNDYVTIESNVELTAFPFTLSTWIKADSSHIGTIVNYADKNVTNKQGGISLRNDGGAGSDDVFAIWNYNIDYNSANSSEIQLNTWYHVVGVFESDTSKILYVNGVNETILTTSSTFPSDVDRTSIGRAGDSTPGAYVNGFIRSVSIYNQVKSAEEVAWLYREPYAMFEPAFSLGALYAAIPSALKPMWYYNMLKRRN